MLVSIVMPVRNAAETLPACLESIAPQTMPDYELIAIDDGSTDASPAILGTAAERDSRIRILDAGRVGLVGALNLGVAESRAPLIARMDADDVMHERRLELQLEFMRGHPEIAVVGSRVELFSDDEILAGYREYVRWQNGCLSSEEIAANLYVESPLAHPSVMMRREAIEAAGGYREGGFPEDYELWLRMNSAGMRFAKVPEVLLQWREQPLRSSRVDPRYSREAFDRIRAEYLARDPLVRGANEIVIWGAGRKTRQRVKLLLERGVTPSGYVDIDPRKIGRTAGGLTVYPPEWLDRSPRPLVLVYVTNHGARELIARRLRELGYRPGVEWLGVG